MFDLRTNPTAKLDPNWVTTQTQKIIQTLSQLSLRPGDQIRLPEFFVALNGLEVDNKNFWILCESFAREAKKNDLVLVYNSGSEFDRRPYVALNSNSSSIGFDQSTYVDLFSKVAKAFLVRSSMFTKPTPEDLLVVEFWTARYSSNSRFSSRQEESASYKSYFLYRAGGDVKSDHGIIAQGRQGQLMAIRIEKSTSGPLVKVYWRDPLGTLQDTTVTTLEGLSERGITIESGMRGGELADDL